MASWERVYGPADVGLVDATLYTVPAGQKLVVRSITVYDRTGTSTAFFIAKGTTGTAANRVLRVVPVAGATLILNDLRLVFYAGDAIHGVSSANPNVVTINGYLITV